ncbi:MAG: 16S rRNA (cytidine(1402)-2'-O)-methyltransferase [Actinomycetota bacterium]|nr:16S rRNA (cytidine(1402)-2'-O)-methyltransferase [Actinomycetota bacterium]
MRNQERAAGTLYLVGTPIGNLGDMSERARTTLDAVDLVAAEDTRRTRGLLASLDVHARLVSFHDANERERTERLLQELRAGRDVAVVSDAGMPGLSDPGFRLVRACAEAGIDVRVVPGPSAVIAALVVSGLPTDRFAFEGFLPRRAGERKARLEGLAAEPRTLVFFESPRRLAATLHEIAGVFGDRRVAVARELTKLHEEVVRGRVSELAGRFDEREPRGEIVLVVEGAPQDRAPVPEEELAEEAGRLVAEGMRARDAARTVARRRGASANDVYRALVERTPTRSRTRGQGRDPGPDPGAT